MTEYLGEFKFKVSGCDSTEEFENHLDEVLALLLEDARVVDPDYTAALKHRVVTFTLTVEADEQGVAFQSLHTALRAAIHGAEGCTPGWERHFTEAGAHVKPMELAGA